MNPSLRITLIAALMIYFLCIGYMLKRKRLELKYSLLWLFAGIVMLLLVIFPNILEKFAVWLGIINYLNGLFSAIIFGLIVLLMYFTMLISELHSKQRNLVQENALLEERVRKLEKRVGGIEEND